MTVSIAANIKQNGNIDKNKELKAVLTGGSAGLAVGLLTAPISNAIEKKMASLNNIQDAQALRDSFNRIIIQAKNGTKIADFSFDKRELEQFDEAYKKLSPLKKIYVKHFNPNYKLFHSGDAMFLPKENVIAMNIEKFGLAGFHEIGHSLNYHSSKILKFIQFSRLPINYAILPILGMISLTTKSKDNIQNNNQKFMDKVKLFIKNNVGKLAALSLLPILFEEYIATKKGNQLAKESLSKDLYSKVKKTNKLGFLTYSIMILSTSLSLWAMNKITDTLRKNPNFLHAPKQKNI